MNWVWRVFSETWGLFVDNGAFAFSIVIWLAIAGALPKLGLSSGSGCMVLFGGLAGLLLWSTLSHDRPP